MSGPLTSEQLSQYDKDGFLMRRGLFDAEEIRRLRYAAKTDQALSAHAFARGDGEGGSVKLALWNHADDSVYGLFARCRRMTDAAEQILRDEPYHYHTKMIMKDAVTGGAWAWHQDYGYWYHNGMLSPNVVSVFIAVDPATRENGCLQVVRGSHRLGRIDHIKVDDQVGADQDRVDAILQCHELIYAEMQPGDAVFFHGNLLHRSDQNHSSKPRWSMVCCYNARSNSPYCEGPHPQYTPLQRVDDCAVRDAVLTGGTGDDRTNWHSGQDSTAQRIST
ncbi:MAG TPA: phytanoyl-CoA dioxygenase family protein [Planctomycetes bacterium]|nr:phytanoyl-CoA dioxygenase family protein [Fuerstiella sp.]HIK90752.1 phytanoyl-CoA dioxygenase family protein [Planctomycetota bacterium]